MKNLPRTFLILGIALVVIGVGIIYASHRTAKAPTTEPVSTEQPTVDPSWQTHTDSSVTFRYPADLGTTYIHTQEWPPKVTVAAGNATCTEGESETGSTKHVTINSHDYCSTTLSEGAAGSTYTTYTYAAQRESKTVTLSFTLRMVQCLNYDNPQQAACLTERNSFKVDDLADRIAQTIELK